jgi:hypothetical protein
MTDLTDSKSQSVITDSDRIHKKKWVLTHKLTDFKGYKKPSLTNLSQLESVMSMSKFDLDQ